MNRSKIPSWAFILLSMYILALIQLEYYDNVPKNKISNHVGTMVNISTYTDKLEYKPEHISTRFGAYNLEFDIDLSNSIVKTVDNYDNYSYIVYELPEEKIYTEIIISEDIPKELEISNNDRKQLLNKNQIYCETSEVDGIYLQKSYINMYNIGYLFIYQQTYDKEKLFGKELLSTINECCYFSKSNSNNFFISIDGIGVLNTNELSFMDNSSGIYFGNDNIARIYNYKHDKAYIYIADINNKHLQTNIDNMEKVEGWKNLYFDRGKDDTESIGYRAFGIETTKGFYYFKVAEDAPKGIESEILNWLRILDLDGKLT